LQLYLLDRSGKIDGAVLSGSAAVDLLAAGMNTGQGLKSFSAAIENPRTDFDWLSRDPKEVDKYIADPLCGFSAKEASQASMFASLMRTADPAALKAIRSGLPLYIFAGDCDPVNGNLEWLRPLADRYRAAGVHNVTTKFYNGGRHEMLNETNRPEVIQDLARWMNAVIGAA
jgi:alpha-beta hydrolase superfamily lysophospholipase